MNSGATHPLPNPAPYSAFVQPADAEGDWVVRTRQIIFAFFETQADAEAYLDRIETLPWRRDT